MSRIAPFVVAFVAAIMLVAGGPPARAAAACDPCPPDCPMMTAAKQDTAKSQKAPAKKSPERPCKQIAPCQPAFAVHVLASVAPEAPVLAVATRLRPLDQLPVASRPPDRSLRPPIQL